MEIGQKFFSKIVILRGYDRKTREPKVEEIEELWEVVQVYDESNLLAQNEKGEIKAFFVG